MTGLLASGTPPRDGLTILRRAGLEDLPTLARFRIEFLRTYKTIGEEEGRTLQTGFESLFATSMRRETMLFWVAEMDGQSVASCGLLLDSRKKRAELMDVYTIHEYRRRGIARALVLDAIAQARRLDLGQIHLQPTIMAVPLYASLGFMSRGEKMVLTL